MLYPLTLCQRTFKESVTIVIFFISAPKWSQITITNFFQSQITKRVSSFLFDFFRPTFTIVLKIISSSSKQKIKNVKTFHYKFFVLQLFGRRMLPTFRKNPCCKQLILFIFEYIFFGSKYLRERGKVVCIFNLYSWLYKLFFTFHEVILFIVEYF